LVRTAAAARLAVPPTMRALAAASAATPRTAAPSTRRLLRGAGMGLRGAGVAGDCGAAGISAAAWGLVVMTLPFLVRRLGCHDLLSVIFLLVFRGEFPVSGEAFSLSFGPGYFGPVLLARVSFTARALRPGPYAPRRGLRRDRHPRPTGRARRRPDSYHRGPVSQLPQPAARCLDLGSRDGRSAPTLASTVTIDGHGPRGPAGLVVSLVGVVEVTVRDEDRFEPYRLVELALRVPPVQVSHD
jgi:hypothetical protein